MFCKFSVQDTILQQEIVDIIKITIAKLIINIYSNFIIYLSSKNLILFPYQIKALFLVKLVLFPSEMKVRTFTVFRIVSL